MYPKSLPFACCWGRGFHSTRRSDVNSKLVTQRLFGASLGTEKKSTSKGLLLSHCLSGVTVGLKCHSPPSSVITKTSALLKGIPLPSTAITLTVYSVYTSSSVISDAVTFPATISPTDSPLLLIFLARAT